MAAFEQIPLVGPGSELQLTLDGRAVPHLEVVGAPTAKPQPVADDVSPATVQSAPSPDGQITF
jgi:hypothetical protein